MNRKETELKFLEVLGLKVGDKIKIIGNTTYVISLVNDKIELYNSKQYYDRCNISLLLSIDWEKVATPLKDKKCEDFYFNHCAGCPFRKRKTLYCICIDYHEQMTLEEIYNTIKQEVNIVKEAIFGGEE